MGSCRFPCTGPGSSVSNTSQRCSAHDRSRAHSGEGSSRARANKTPLRGCIRVHVLEQWPPGIRKRPPHQAYSWPAHGSESVAGWEREARNLPRGRFGRREPDESAWQQESIQARRGFLLRPCRSERRWSPLCLAWRCWRSTRRRRHRRRMGRQRFRPGHRPGRPEWRPGHLRWRLPQPGDRGRLLASGGRGRPLRRGRGRHA